MIHLFCTLSNRSLPLLNLTLRCPEGFIIVLVFLFNLPFAFGSKQNFTESPKEAIFEEAIFEQCHAAMWTKSAGI
jgi:hypothetical protein